MKKRVAVILALGALMPRPAMAIPAFARRYQISCHICHDIYPKLTMIGQRFKERGFRMEREEQFDASKWLSSVPLVIHPRVSRSFIENAQGATFGFIEGISAGNLGDRFSYWVDDTLVISDSGTTHAKPDNAWLRFEVLRGDRLHAKAGRIELDIPFTQVRSPHLFPYEVYSANTGFEADNIGRYHEGIELGGSLPSDVHWSTAFVKGLDTGGDVSGTSHFGVNLYVRIAKRVNEHRLGAFAYLGHNNLAFNRNIAWEDSLQRFGVDGSVWISRLNVYGVYMHGRNSNSLASAARPTGTQQPLSFDAGFLQADYHVRPEVALTLRLNILNQPGPDLRSQTLSSLFPGIQVWIFERLKLSFEYGFLNQKRNSFGAVQAEVAF